MYIIIGGDGKEYGPITQEDVRQWIAEGRLNAQSLAKSVSDAEFRPLDKFPEFADVWGGGGTPGTIAPPTLSTDDWLAQVIARPPELRLGECL
ncbi:MAG: GYF domain-containing protein, partial [Verrucomicrobiota bacterium]